MEQIKLPMEDAVVRSTVRLLAGPIAGQPTSVGTGFFYKVVHPLTNNAKLLILTNKHVIRDAEVIHFVLSITASLEKQNENEQHQPKDREDRNFVWPLAGNIYMHPDGDMDLCAIDITVPAGQILLAGQKLRSTYIDSSWLPQKADRDACRDVEQVLVAGYPNGLWDHHNNMPIARVGTTATHMHAHYQGKRQFLADVAAFQGSSGSPVFSYEAGVVRDQNGGFILGTKAQFVGVVWGVVEKTVEGEIEVVEIPAAVKSVAKVQSSLHLAVALHADAILEIEQQVLPVLGPGVAA